MADLVAGSAFSAVNSVFVLVDFIIKVQEVGSENEVFVRTIQRVRYDSEETERLLRVPSVKLVLQNAPEQSHYIKNVIYTTKNALNEIGLYVERVRSDLERDGEVRFAHRIRWVLNDHGKLENRRSELAVCHQALTTVLSTLHSVELVGSLALNTQIAVQNTSPQIYADLLEDSFIGPNQRRERRSKSAVAIMVSENITELDGEEIFMRNHASTCIEPQPRWFTTRIGAVEMTMTSSTPHVSKIIEQDDGVQSLQWPTAPSSDISQNNNNLGALNPWDDWNSDTGKEVYEQGITLGSTNSDHWPASWSMVALSSTILPPLDQLTPMDSPNLLPSRSSDEVVAGGADSNASFQRAGQASTLATVGGSSISDPTAGSEPDHSTGLPPKLIVEISIGKPVPLRTKSIDFMSWLQNKVDDRSLDTTSPTTQPRHGLNSAVAWYNKHRSMPSITNRISASLPSSPSQLGDAEQNMAPRTFWPRSQIDVPPRPLASINHPVSAPTVPLIPYVSSQSSSSTTPFSLLPDSQDSIALMRKPEVVGSGTASNILSQSRRRRAAMEAAVGATGT